MEAVPGHDLSCLKRSIDGSSDVQRAKFGTKEALSLLRAEHFLSISDQSSSEGICVRGLYTQMSDRQTAIDALGVDVGRCRTER